MTGDHNGAHVASPALAPLVEDSRTCTRCPTMDGRPRVLGPACGPETARCLVIAEAPGTHGAARTGTPLQGDHSGDSFATLLAEAGIAREDLFVSNAVLCSPRGRTPSKLEVGTCSHFTRSLIALLDPAMVVTLGATALASTEHIQAHGLTLKWDVGELKRWFGRFLLPLYHPGPRAMIQRPLAQQRQDYALWASLMYG